MSSEVEICNMALAEVRGTSINSLDEAGVPAQQCKLQYPIARDTLLRSLDWGFARKVAPLALTTKEVFNWAYIYQYPSDCIQILRLVLNFTENEAGVDGVASRFRFFDDAYLADLSAQVEYKIYNVEDTKVVAANESDLRIEYQANITDPLKFDVVFTQALALLLASKLAIPIAGAQQGRGLRQDIIQQYTAFVRDATANDRNESYTPPIESDFILVRQ